MESRSVITKLRGRTSALGLSLAVACVLGAASTEAHDAPRTAMRELVRLQGFVEEAKADEAGEAGAPDASGGFALVVHGRQIPFEVVDRQVFRAVAAAGRPSEPEAQKLVLQGERALLARIGSARPDQKVTILGERRPGGDELFVAAVDLCPES
ncbi:MAG: hypothetical protein FJ144_25945 [Deltaproteobacteria bacterium]|nr:hypothetical protein [Deltaproteobacteria bacterium]